MNKKYEQFVVKANELWDDFTTGKGKKVPNEGQLSKQSTIKQAGGGSAGF
jgi:hypothetical protein